MYTSSSYRIGSRASEATEYASSPESSVLRSLFELRKSYSNQSDDSAIQHLTFWNCIWSPRVLQSLRKIFIRDRRSFASIKFFDCAIDIDTDTDTDQNNSQLFEDILRMILVNNSTASLVIKGGKLVGTKNSQQRPQSSCRFSPSVSTSNCLTTSITSALREGLSTSTSLTSLALFGLDFSSPSTVKDISNALSRNATLQSVNLRQSSLDDESIAQILRSVVGHPTLTSLDLSRNYLGARKSNAAFSSTKALDSVAELLQSKSSKLEHLNLSNQYQQHPREPTSTLPPITQLIEEDVQQQILQHKTAFGKTLGALSTNRCLKSIDLSRNPGCLSDPSSVEVLAACLSANACLEHVNISNCGMTPGSIAYLASECLPVCGTSLKSLVLFGSLPGVNSTEIPNSTTQNCPSTIIKQGPLGVHNGDCNDASALALEKGLLLNVTLENLGDLPCNCENETIGRTYRRIQHTLNLNKAGRRVFRSSLPLANWSHLLARADNLDCTRSSEETTKHDGGSDNASVVFSLLRHGSILMEH